MNGKTIRAIAGGEVPGRGEAHFKPLLFPALRDRLASTNT